MPRKSLADQIIEEVEKLYSDKDEKGWFLVTYDIDCSRREIPIAFYRNLERLQRRYGFDFIQKSVYMCFNLKSVIALKKLVEHYRGYVRVFKVEKEINVKS